MHPSSAAATEPSVDALRRLEDLLHQIQSQAETHRHVELGDPQPTQVTKKLLEEIERICMRLPLMVDVLRSRVNPIRIHRDTRYYLDDSQQNGQKREGISRKPTVPQDVLAFVKDRLMPFGRYDASGRDGWGLALQAVKGLSIRVLDFAPPPPPKIPAATAKPLVDDPFSEARRRTVRRSSDHQRLLQLLDPFCQYDETTGVRHFLAFRPFIPPEASRKDKFVALREQIRDETYRGHLRQFHEQCENMNLGNGACFHTSLEAATQLGWCDLRHDSETFSCIPVEMVALEAQHVDPLVSRDLAHDDGTTTITSVRSTLPIGADSIRVAAANVCSGFDVPAQLRATNYLTLIAGRNVTPTHVGYVWVEVMGGMLTSVRGW